MVWISSSVTGKQVPVEVTSGRDKTNLFCRSELLDFATENIGFGREKSGAV